MSKSWFVEHNGRVVGPASSTQLKQLASASKIKPETKVRLGEDGEWIRAGKVQGLFTQIATSKPKRPAPGPTPERPQSTPPPMPAGSTTATVAAPRDAPPASKSCPMCGETIASTAIKCRHCNEFLDGRPQTQPQAQSQPQFIAPQAPSHTTVYVQQQGEVKSVALALLLTFFFGPLGMLYSTPVGALVMIGAWIVIIALCFVVVGVFLIPVAWIVQMVWAAMACQPRR